MRAHQTVSAHSFISYQNLFKVFDFIYMIYNSFSSALFEPEGTMPTSSHGLAHLENNAVFADDSFSLACVYVASCLKRMPSAPQGRLRSTSWVFKMTSPSTMKTNTRLQRELPQDLILMDLTSLCFEYKMHSFSMYAVKNRNNLELMLCVTKHSPSHRPDHVGSMSCSNLGILFKGAEIPLTCWGQSKSLYLLYLSFIWRWRLCRYKKLAGTGEVRDCEQRLGAKTGALPGRWKGIAPESL